jgi:hypothetical protein
MRARIAHRFAGPAPVRPWLDATTGGEVDDGPRGPEGARGPRLSIVVGVLAPSSGSGVTRPPGRARRAAATIGDTARAHHRDAAPGRIDRAPIDAARALLAEGRARWFETALEISRLLRQVPPGGMGDPVGVPGAPRRLPIRRRPGRPAGIPDAGRRGGIEAIAWFGEER